MIRLVTLDAFGLLYTPIRPVEVQYSEIAAKYNINVPPHTIKSSFRSGIQIPNKYESFSYTAFKNMNNSYPIFGYHEGMSTQQWWTKVRKADGAVWVGWLVRVLMQVINETFRGNKIPPSLTNDLIERFASKEGYFLYEDVIPFLQYLESKDILCGIISNSDDRVRSILNSFGIGHYFNFMVFSSDVGHEKPHSAMFSTALGLSGLAISCENALHIGDEYEKDVQGALQAGWNAVLVQRNSKSTQICDKVDSLLGINLQ